MSRVSDTHPLNNPRMPAKPHHEELGDFTTTVRVLPISALAMAIGAVCAFVALALLRLIELFTNLFYFGRWSTAMVSPVGNDLGWYSVFIPIGGALIIGVMARYGSERIRGHGIPEAIEAILINGSRVEPKVALLKPISSAISIGSGGPFGEEEGRQVGVLTRGAIRQRAEQAGESALHRPLDELVRHETGEAFPDEPLRVVVYRMAEKGITRMPVVERASGKLLGLISLDDLLKARTRHFEEERRREQVLNMRFFLPGGRVRNEPGKPVVP